MHHFCSNATLMTWHKLPRCKILRSVKVQKIFAELSFTYYPYLITNRLLDQKILQWALVFYSYISGFVQMGFFFVSYAYSSGSYCTSHCNKVNLKYQLRLNKFRGNAPYVKSWLSKDFAEGDRLCPKLFRKTQKSFLRI